MKRTILLAVLAVGYAAPAAADVWWRRAPAQQPVQQYVSQYAPQHAAMTSSMSAAPMTVSMATPMSVSATPSMVAPMTAPALYTYTRPMVQQSPCAPAPMSRMSRPPIVSTAHARPCGSAWGGPAWGGGLSFGTAVAHYERWLNNFEAQIRTGEMSGRLTQNEARRARMRQQEIARLLGDARNDNQIDMAENQRLGQAVARQAQRLQRLTGNYRRMYGAASAGGLAPANLGPRQFNLLGGAPAPASAVTVAPAGGAVTVSAATTTAGAAGGDAEKWLNW